MTTPITDTPATDTPATYPSKDIHGLDKWARAFTKSILEYNGLLWQERCPILKRESDLTYEKRQRQQDWNLCLHLRKHKHLIQYNDHHYLYKPETFFTKGPLDAIQLWREKICLSIDPAPIKSNHDIRPFFSTLHENEPTTPPRKRKRDTPTKKKSWTQGDLLQFQFTRTVPSSPNTDEETQEPLLPPSFEEMIQRKQAHKNRSLVKQSSNTSTSIHRQTLNQSNPNSTFHQKSD